MKSHKSSPVRTDSNALLAQREKEFQQQTQKLEREVEAAREKEQDLVTDLAKSRHETTLRVNQIMADLDQASLEKKRLEQDAEYLRRETRATKDTAARQQRTMQDALDLKARLADEVQRENRRLLEERDLEIAKITELKEDELERLQDAIKGQYAPSRTVAEVVTCHDQLERHAETLASRVHEHLGDTM